MNISEIFVAAAVICLNLPLPARATDIENGRKEFEQDCAVCHSVKQGKNKIGPSLFGIVGRKAASIADFNYSDAMRAYNAVWTPEVLKPYISSPQAAVPGVKMAFRGEESDKDIDDIIAYLSTLK